MHEAWLKKYLWRNYSITNHIVKYIVSLQRGLKCVRRPTFTRESVVVIILLRYHMNFTVHQEGRLISINNRATKLYCIPRALGVIGAGQRDFDFKCRSPDFSAP